MQKEFAEQTNRLDSYTTELNRIDAALLAAAKAGTPPPLPYEIFGALGRIDRLLRRD